MKLLITGANGMLARDLIVQLQKEGWPCAAFSKEELDITDAHSIEKQLLATLPEVVINCAAYTHVDQAETDDLQVKQVNQEGVAQLARLCKNTRSKLVHISTDFVFDGRRTAPYSESDVPNPLGIYGKTKWGGEQAILQLDFDYLIVRTSWLYGVDGKNFVKTILRLAKERAELQVVADQIGSPTWTADLAQALAHLLKVKASGLFHFSNQGQCSWYEFACEIMQTAYQQGMLSKKIPVRSIASADYPTPAKRPAFSVLDCQKYSALTQQTIPSWQDSLARMLTQLS